MNENMNLIPKIEEIVCKVFNITLEDLRGNGSEQKTLPQT